MRKYLRAIATLSAIVLVLAACGGEASTTTDAPGATTTTAADSDPGELGDELVVGVWGGVWETALNELIPDFEEQTGVEVTLDISSSTDRVAKLQAGAGGSTMDVAFLTPEAMAVAAENGLVADVDEETVPNLAITAEPLLENFASDGGYYAVPVSWTSQGILWREDLVPFEIVNFTDLWRPELEGRIAIQNMPTLGAASTLIQAAHAHGGSQEDLEPGWEALEDLRPNIQQFFSVSSDALAALVNGDLWAVVTIAGQGVALADEGVRITIPAEGATYSIQAVAVTASAANPTAAEQFIDFLMSPEVQARWVELTLAAPGGEDVPVPSEIEEQLAESPELLPNLIPVDFLDMGLNMQEWSERWQREIAS